MVFHQEPARAGIRVGQVDALIGCMHPVTFSIDDDGFDQHPAVSLRAGTHPDVGGLTKGFFGIEHFQFIARHPLATIHPVDFQAIWTRLEIHFPVQSCCRESGRVPAFFLQRDAVQNHLRGLGVAVRANRLRAARRAVPLGPRVTINMTDRIVAPAAFENPVRFLGASFPVHQAFLIDIRNGVLSPQRRGEILERPLRIAGKARLGLRNHQVPVEQVDDVGFAPVASLGDADDTRLVDHLFHADLAARHAISAGWIRVVPPNVAGTPVFHVQQSRVFFLRIGERAGILEITATVPAGPDRGRKDIHDVPAGVILANGCQARRVQFVRYTVEVAQVRVHGGFVTTALEIRQPVDFVAQRPEEYARVVAVLPDHLAQHRLRIAFPVGATEPAPAPGQFVPENQPQAVGSPVDRRILGIVPQAYEIRAQFLDHFHVTNVQWVRHGSAVAGMLFMPVRASQEQALTIEFKRAVVSKTEPAQAKGFG